MSDLGTRNTVGSVSEPELQRTLDEANAGDAR
jgi:hypothetical protein